MLRSGLATGKIFDQIVVVKKAIILYGFSIAAIAFALEWLEYQYVARIFSAEIYIILIAAGFAALGVWVGIRLTQKSRPGAFDKNIVALKSLGVTDREYEVLERLADGRSNKEIARILGISPNTVKTHVARLYEKLEVRRRTQVIQKARALELIP